MANQKINSTNLKTETFGVEIEGYGKRQSEVASLLHTAFINWADRNGVARDGCRHYHRAQHLNDWVVIDPQGREWTVVSDSSLRDNSSGRDETFELVTPVLRYNDIEMLQELVRYLRENGCKSDARHGCGVHIHVGIKNDEHPATPKSIRALANIVKNHEKLIVKAINMTHDRYDGGYANSISSRLVNNLNAKKPTTWESLQKVHYDTLGGCPQDHYNQSRYYFLNLHAIWDLRHQRRAVDPMKGTVEFRCFEFQGNLHAGWLKAWIQLCMALVSYSKLVSYARPHEVYDANEKWAMKNFLNNLGLIGDEFKTCRVLFSRRLDGDASQRVPAVRMDTLDDLNLDE